MTIGTGDGTYWRYGRPIRFWDSLAPVSTAMAATVAAHGTVAAALTVPKGLSAASAAVSSLSATATTWTPALVSGLKLWLKADAGVYSDAGITLAADGGTIRQWNDQSGSGNHVSQATSGNRPTWIAPYLGDIGSVRFNSNHRLDSTLDLGGATAATAFAVYEQADSGILWSIGTASEALEPNIFSYDWDVYHTGRVGTAQTTPHCCWLAEWWYDGSQATNATRFKAYADTRQLPLNFSGTAFPSSLAAGSGFRVGGSVQGDGAWLGKLRELLIYQGVPSPSERSQINAYLLARHGQGTRKILTTTGDSITHGLTATPGGSFPSALMTLLGPDWQVNNMALGGSALSSWVSTWKDQLSYVPSGSHPMNVEIVGLGTNDIQGGASAATIQANLTTYWAARKTAGQRIIAGKILPRSTFNAGSEAIRVAVNVWLDTQVGSAIDGVADYPSDARLQDPLNATYYTDGTHPTTAGYAVMAGIAQAAINNLPVVASPRRRHGRGRSPFELLRRMGI